MKNQANSRAESPPHDAIGGKSVKIERFAWVHHAKARGIATPEYLGCGDAWDESPSRGAHNPRPRTHFLPARLVTVRGVEIWTQTVLLPTKPELPELPPLARTSAQLAILALDRAEFAQLRASGRVHKLPSRVKRAPRKGPLVSAHLEDLRAPTTPPVAGGRICTTRANAWCAEYAHPRTVGVCDRGSARAKRVKQAVCHARRVKHATCKASTIRAIDARKGSGTVLAAQPLTPHLVRAIEGVSSRRDVVSRIAAYAAARGWHRVCPTPETTETPAQAAMTVPTPPAQAVRRVIPVDVALARGLLARKLQVIGHIDAVVTPRVTQD